MVGRIIRTGRLNMGMRTINSVCLLATSTFMRSVSRRITVRGRRVRNAIGRMTGRIGRRQQDNRNNESVYRYHYKKENVDFCQRFLFLFVDLVRFELTTFSMPLRRAPNCAIGPAFEKRLLCGPGEIRTHDLFSAIEARSQLRYRPGLFLKLQYFTTGKEKMSRRELNSVHFQRAWAK